MQKCVSLARAIAADPEIIVFDEPTTGPDLIMADVIDNLIAAVNRKVNATALTITHDMKSAQKHGNRIAMLYEGRIIWDGPASKARTSSNEYLDQFEHGRTDGSIEMTLRS